MWAETLCNMCACMKRACLNCRSCLVSILLLSVVLYVFKVTEVTWNRSSNGLGSVVCKVTRKEVRIWAYNGGGGGVCKYVGNDILSLLDVYTISVFPSALEGLPTHTHTHTWLCVCGPALRECVVMHCNTAKDALSCASIFRGFPSKVPYLPELHQLMTWPPLI